VGNETREMGEITGGRQQANGPASDQLIADLARLARTEDPTRLSTYASHHRADDLRNFHTEVMGFNKYFGWYGGAAEDFAGWVDDAHRRFPALRISMSEYGAGANIRQHTLAPVKPVPDGAWHPEEYQAQFHEVYWEAMRTRPYLWGKFIWNLFDFAVDSRAEGDAPGLNDKGLVTYDRRTKKDAFYWYKANWSSEPVLYLTSRRFAERPAGQTEIKVYSNAPQVELFLNGVSCGVVASDMRIFRWNVELVEGANNIVAKAQCGSTTMADECTLVAVTKRIK
jgi:beta-galactosidase